MDSHLDTVLSVYSDQGVRFDALGVIIIQLLAEHESHGRPILDAGLLEQFLREFKIPFPFDLKTSYTGIILFDKILRDLTRFYNYWTLLHHKICQEGFFLAISERMSYGENRQCLSTLCNDSLCCSAELRSRLVVVGEL